jgi:DNA segregation ATPase FtsK/SpoIIIE, S-DNA-T family
MTESSLQIQKKQINAIRSLICETTASETELQDRIKIARSNCAKKQATDLEETEEKYKQLRENVDRKKESTISKIDNRKELEPELLKDRHKQRVVEINTHAEELTEDTETKFNEAIWLAESVYEAAIAVPREKAEEQMEALEDCKDALDKLVDEAPKTLSRLRQNQGVVDADSGNEAKNTMASYVQGATEALDQIQNDPKAMWCSGYRPILIVLIATSAGTGVGGATTNWELTFPLFAYALGALALALLVIAVTFASGKNSVKKKYKKFTSCIALAKIAYDKSIASIDTKRRVTEKGITMTRDIELKIAEDKYKPRLENVDRLLKKDITKEKVRFETVASTLANKVKEDLTSATSTHKDRMQQYAQDEQTAIDSIHKTYEDTITAIDNDERDTMQALTDRWQKEFTSYHESVDFQNDEVTGLHPSWNENWSDWKTPTKTITNVPIGSFVADLTTIAGDLPKSKTLQLFEDKANSLPLCSTLPSNTSILVSSTGKQRSVSIALLQNSILRMLTSVPPGKAKFTLIDPVGLGQSFASILHLADYEESQLLDRAWTEPRHIETQLARLTEHMETVIQKYLRNEFESIDAYNEQAGEIAEPYRFLVIADLPNNFSENACKRLTSIITSGARCGVHVIIHRDVSLPLPAGIDEDTLYRIPLRIVENTGTFCIDEDELRDLPLTLEEPPCEETATVVVKQVGETADNTHRVEVPFSVIGPTPDEIWSRSTKDKVVVPLGRSGATKLQNLTLGRGTAQHALIAGKTGSGKSTLLHVLITNLALWYSPDEIEFYLVDFKKGVEFKTYAMHKLPHARVVAVESDREFGISVLQRIDAELKRRGELFRDVGVQDIAGFREKSDERMPRILLIIDEFQEFFVDDDHVAQEANLLLDRLVRQGRAFGIHAIMGSQTLDGAYTLSRSTMGQMAVRVALQCSEQDSYIILNEDNAAARLLSRPGEAIYNDAAGNIEGNSPFQVVWLNDKEREVFIKDLIIRDKGNERDMVVYEGNQPLHLVDNPAFQETNNSTKPLASKAWLGGAMAIKEDTSATFRTASASNLLIVGQQDETTTCMMSSALLSLEKQFPSGDVSFIVLDGTPKDQQHASILPNAMRSMANSPTVVGVREVESVMTTLNTELQKRLADGAGDAPTIFLCISGLHRFRDLRRNEDDYGFSMDEEKQKTPAQVLAELLKEGPTLGIHVIVSTDTLSNLNRAFDRQSLREFDMRVLLQMGANDSTNLIDMPDASKLGMHRALLYSEETGTIEPFRPYAQPAPGS